MIDRFGKDHVAQSQDVNKEILELFVNDKVILASQPHILGPFSFILDSDTIADTDKLLLDGFDPV